MIRIMGWMLVSVLWALPVQAQTGSVAGLGTADASAPNRHAREAGFVPTDDALYLALGGQEAIARLVNELVDRAVQDPRISGHFKDTRPEGLKESLSQQICVISGGPCIYEGATMKKAHADLGLRKADFLALVQDLQNAMTAQGISFPTQNRLLARLAPMYRDVVTVH